MTRSTFVVVLRRTLVIASLGCIPTVAFAGSILVDEPKGVILKLVKTGKPECGTLDWESIRQSGSFTASGKTLTVKETKLPLSKEQWQALLTKVVGAQDEITIVQAWPEAAGGLAASLRVAYDLRSHGGKAWVLNGALGERKVVGNCSGQYAFTGQPEKVYMTEQEFWANFERGAFLDARGKEADDPAAYTWVVGSPQGAKRAEPSAFVKNGKVDPSAYSCDAFAGVTVVGCDSIHKSMLAMEAARLKGCATQPGVMPYWGLTGFSRDVQLAKKIWGEQAALNPKRSGNWATP
jgi:hypothetical protein